ncbi:MAG: leucine-rich repeat domain-containing protein [Oscillospiraceae bacterium]|nr:leucine-rich repeat domain-containing protein [Oscillospiraceae bacterium]
MNDNRKSVPESGATVIMNTHELEKRLRYETDSSLKDDSDVVIYPDGLDLSEFRFDDGDVTVAERPAVPENSERASVAPIIEKRVPEKRPRTSENAKRIIEENAEKRASGKRKKRNIIIVLSVVAVIAVLVIGSMALRSAAQNKEYRLSFEAAQNYYFDGEYDKALETLRRAMQTRKTDECLLLMSACYEAKGDFVNAIAILESSNSGSEEIAKRIEKLEKARKEYEEGKTVLILGESYDIGTTFLDLSGKHVRSARLQDLQKLEKLTSLKLNGNLIDELSFLTPLKNLVSLDLSENNISDITTLSGMQSLRTLHLDKNKIKDFTPLYSLRGLTTLTIGGMEISESQLKELKKALPDCIVFSDEASEDVVDIRLGGKTFKSNVKELDLSNCGLTDIYALSVCTKLESLNLSGNSIQDLTPLMDMAELRSLDLSGNRISSIMPLMGLTNLERLNLEGNSITSIAALSEHTKLTELYLKGNSPKSFTALGKLSGLKYLGLQNTGINDTGLSSLYSLKSLKTVALEDNTEITAAGVDELKKKLPDCKVSHSPLVEQIEIGGKKINTDAETVELSGLGITDISALSKLSAVKKLDLSENSISDFSVLYELKTLQSLDVAGNGITPEQLSALEAALPDCVVNAM